MNTLRITKIQENCLYIVEYISYTLYIVQTEDIHFVLHKIVDIIYT